MGGYVSARVKGEFIHKMYCRSSLVLVDERKCGTGFVYGSDSSAALSKM